MGHECFEALSEHDCQQIYDNHQRELVENAKHNFQVRINISYTNSYGTYILLIIGTFTGTC